MINEIYLEDLKEEKQKEILEFLNEDKTNNFEVFPLFSLEVEDLK